MAPADAEAVDLHLASRVAADRRDGACDVELPDAAMSGKNDESGHFLFAVLIAPA
jgi:hypothetical protein